jgi:superfamily II DNA helicase RecQ
VSVTTPDIFVVKRDMLIYDLRKDIGMRTVVLTDDKVNTFYEILQKYSLADAKTKEQHIQNIVDKCNKNSETSAAPIFVDSVICRTSYSEDKLLVEKIETIEKKSIESELSLEDTPIYKALKQYRFETCKAEGVQAYCIFNNAQMLAIIAAMPSSLEDLKKISGFGDVKCQKYGDKILEIVRSNRTDRNERRR